MHLLAQISGVHKRESTSNYVCLNFCLCRDMKHAGNDNLIGGSYFIAVVVMWCQHSTHSTHKSTPRAVAQGARCQWCAIYIIVDSYHLSTLQADACSSGGHACCCCCCPAICCLSVSCLLCCPSSIATPHPPCKQMLAAVVVVLVAVIVVLLSVVHQHVICHVICH